MIPIAMSTSNGRVYEKQFASEQKGVVSPILMTSIILGKIKTSSFPLLLESMRRNPSVTFVTICVVEDGTDHHGEIKKIGKHGVHNFHVMFITMSEFAKRVSEKLGITITLSKEWHLKMNDFKPTLPFLYPEILKLGDNNQLFKYWGYFDMDIVWGNFDRFADLFQGDNTFVISGYNTTVGAASWFKNEDWTYSLFKTNDQYVSFLSNSTYLHLDGNGPQHNHNHVNTNTQLPTMSNIQQKLINSDSNKYKFNKNRHYLDTLYFDRFGPLSTSGPITWHNGKLKVIHASNFFPAGRELLFFHRPDHFFQHNHKDGDLIQHTHKENIISDMIEFGYLLPSWIPLLTRYLCYDRKMLKETTVNALGMYKPYDPSCFIKTYDEIEAKAIPASH
eukprot:gene12669-16985_t